MRETYIFLLRQELTRVTMNFDKGSYIVYSGNGVKAKYLLGREGLTPQQMQEVKKEIIKYMKNKRRFLRL